MQSFCWLRSASSIQLQTAQSGTKNQQDVQPPLWKSPRTMLQRLPCATRRSCHFGVCSKQSCIARTCTRTRTRTRKHARTHSHIHTYRYRMCRRAAYTCQPKKHQKPTHGSKLDRQSAHVVNWSHRALPLPLQSYSAPQRQPEGYLPPPPPPMQIVYTVPRAHHYDTSLQHKRHPRGLHCTCWLDQ